MGRVVCAKAACGWHAPCVGDDVTYVGRAGGASSRSLSLRYCCAAARKSAAACPYARCMCREGGGGTTPVHRQGGILLGAPGKGDGPRQRLAVTGPVYVIKGSPIALARLHCCPLGPLWLATNRRVYDTQLVSSICPLPIALAGLRLDLGCRAPGRGGG